jgi:para-aminobenzoate synthetase component I
MIRRTVHTFPVTDKAAIKNKLLLWTRRFRAVCVLDNNDFRYPGRFEPAFEMAVAAEAVDSVSAFAGVAFEALDQARQARPDWWFGGLGYELKNEVEHHTSENADGLEFPDLRFFSPRFLWLLRGWKVELHVLEGETEDPSELWRQIRTTEPGPEGQVVAPKAISWESRLDREAYLERFDRIQKHIRQGDIYEMNFCREYFAEGAEIDPWLAFQAVQKRTQAPFSAFWRWEEEYLLCASPERYLRKEGQRVISQPIKGTAARSSDEPEDLRLKEALRNSRKERGENVMIVDLVRNDLSRVAARDSVHVDELYGIYTFETVHQMISTVRADLAEGKTWSDLLRATFPMGSMTGAPKVRAMQIIEEMEESRRGWYSGGLGYIDPQGQGDFNVVIRSLIYRADRRYLSLQVGGALTILSDGAEEWKETELKARALLEAVHQSNPSHETAE